MFERLQTLHNEQQLVWPLIAPCLACQMASPLFLIPQEGFRS